jgi:hypothetical protein
MLTTENWELPLFEDGDLVDPLNAALNLQSTQMEEALNESVGRSASAAERDTRRPNPIQGDRMYRTDKGWTEAYFDLFSVSNMGGASPAGWYPISGNLPVCILTATGSSFPNNLERTIGSTEDYAPVWVEESDNHSWHPGGSDVTPTIPGMYTYSLTSGWDSGVSGSRLTRLKRNNTGGIQSGSITMSILSNSVQPTGHANASIDQFRFNGTSDYVRCSAFHNNGAGLGFSARFVMRYVGPPVY